MMAREYEALIAAIKANDVSKVKEILARGIDVNQRWYGLTPPLHWAVNAGHAR